MIEFHEPTIADRAWMQPILYAAGFPGADYTFNNMYFWSEYFFTLATPLGVMVPPSLQDAVILQEEMM